MASQTREEMIIKRAPKDAEGIATRDAYGNALAALGAENPNVVVLDADLSGSTKTAVFKKKFPERFINVGVAEQDLIATAAGLASMGKIAFASSFAMFAAGRAWEVIRQSAAYPHLNVKVVASHAGLTVGEDGASHQAIEDIACMRVIPDMTVLVPADGTETEAVIRAAAAHEGPCYVRVSRAKTPLLFDAPYPFKIGKAAVLKPTGDVLFIACGVMVSEALAAAQKLEAEGISVAFINMASIKPFDVDTVVSLAASSRAVFTFEEHSIIGGLGSAVAEVLSEHCPKPLYRFGVRDVFGQSGTATALMAHYRLTASALYEDTRACLKTKGWL